MIKCICNNLGSSKCISQFCVNCCNNNNCKKHTNKKIIKTNNISDVDILSCSICNDTLSNFAIYQCNSCNEHICNDCIVDRIYVSCNLNYCYYCSKNICYNSTVYISCITCVNN